MCCEAVLGLLVPILATTQVALVLTAAGIMSALALLWVSFWVAYLALSSSDKGHR